MMEQAQYIELLHKFADGSITIAEAEEFKVSWSTLSFIEREALEREYETIWPTQADKRTYNEGRLAQMHERIGKWEGNEAIPVVHRVHFLRTAWFRYAAILMLFAGTATFIFKINQPQKDITQKKPTTSTPDIQPGGNKAILTLSDGSTIVLDSAANGNLALQGNAKIIKLDDGELAYVGQSGNSVSYNTITTPRGGQYQITLSDGTNVWLNAASSIRFPTSFVKDRIVEIIGESYVEVADDKQKPFQIKAGATIIQVLGTSLNVNAYADENTIKTTLITGSVLVIENNQKALLKPGQHASMVANNKLVVEKADVARALAWKNGLFNFENTSLEEAMRQLSRWYNIDVVYKDQVPNIQFGGKIRKDLMLRDALDFLRDAGLRFTFTGRTLTIIK